MKPGGFPKMLLFPDFTKEAMEELQNVSLTFSNRNLFYPGHLMPRIASNSIPAIELPFLTKLNQ